MNFHTICFWFDLVSPTNKMHNCQNKYPITPSKLCQYWCRTDATFNEATAISIISRKDWKLRKKRRSFAICCRRAGAMKLELVSFTPNKPIHSSYLFFSSSERANNGEIWRITFVFFFKLKFIGNVFFYYHLICLNNMRSQCSLVDKIDGFWVLCYIQNTYNYYYYYQYIHQWHLK